MHGAAATQPGLSVWGRGGGSIAGARRTHSGFKRRATPMCPAEGETILAPGHPAR
jgi:hypothetical protein